MACEVGHAGAGERRGLTSKLDHAMRAGQELRGLLRREPSCEQKQMMSHRLSVIEPPSENEASAPGSNRAFGGVVAAVFAVIASWPLISGHQPRWWSLGVSVSFLLASLIVPNCLTPLNRAWFALGKLLHAVMSPFVMGVVFFAVVTPTAALRRMIGREVVSLKFDPSAKSYWIMRKPPGPEPQSIKNQF